MTIGIPATFWRHRRVAGLLPPLPPPLGYHGRLYLQRKAAMQTGQVPEIPRRKRRCPNPAWQAVLLLVSYRAFAGADLLARPLTIKSASIFRAREAGTRA